VAREEPSPAPNAQRQTRAGFPTYSIFGSLPAFLPFTTLGWPEKTRDQSVFYPTTLLITAYEILFFWSRA